MFLVKVGWSIAVPKLDEIKTRKITVSKPFEIAHKDLVEPTLWRLEAHIGENKGELGVF